MGRKRRTAFIAAKREERLAHGTPQGTLTALIACIMYILNFTTNEIKKEWSMGRGRTQERDRNHALVRALTMAVWPYWAASINAVMSH